MWLIKLPFKLLAAIAAFLLSFIIVVCNILKGLSTIVLSLALVLLVLLGIYAAVSADWVVASVILFEAFVVFVAMFFMEAFVMAMEGLRNGLSNFLFS